MQIVANWKQFLAPTEELALADKLIATPPLLDICDLCILPSYLSLMHIAESIKTTGANLKVGAQDLAAQLVASQTGNIRADFLPVDTVLVGHSERATYNHETIGDQLYKLTTALNSQKEVILCFGEKTPVATDDVLLKELKDQLLQYLPTIGNHSAQITLAYEPQWTIGSTQTASSALVKKVLALAQALGFPHMLYGGSVNEETVEQVHFEELHGFLVGRAATQFDSLKNLIEKVSLLGR